MTCAACSTAAGCAEHSLLDVLPRCTVCAANGRDRPATHSAPVKLGRWYTCDEHARGAELPYADAVRAAGRA